MFCVNVCRPTAVLYCKGAVAMKPAHSTTMYRNGSSLLEVTRTTAIWTCYN